MCRPATAAFVLRGHERLETDAGEVVAADPAGLYRKPVSSARCRLKHLSGKDDVRTVEGHSLRGCSPQQTAQRRRGWERQKTSAWRPSSVGTATDSEGRGRAEGAGERAQEV